MSDEIKAGMRAILGNQAIILRALALLLEGGKFGLYKAAQDAKLRAHDTDVLKVQLFPNPFETSGSTDGDSK